MGELIDGSINVLSAIKPLNPEGRLERSPQDPCSSLVPPEQIGYESAHKAEFGRREESE
jgi:hypothetical protein